MSTVQAKENRWFEVGKRFRDHHCQTKSQRISLEQSFQVVTFGTDPSPHHWNPGTCGKSLTSRWDLPFLLLAICGVKFAASEWTWGKKKERFRAGRDGNHSCFMNDFVFQPVKINSPSFFLFFFTLSWLMAQRFPWVWYCRQYINIHSELTRVGERIQQNIQ